VNAVATRRVVLLGAVAGGAIAGYFKFLRTLHMTWGATQEEVSSTLPGDELMPNAKIVSTRAVEIDAPASAVWPWLVQMGPGRGGAYTYDWIERRIGVELQNADRIVPELQQMAVGDEFPMPGGYTFRVEILDPEKTLAFRTSDGRWVWSFELAPAGGHTRLISRNRIDTSTYAKKDWMGYAVTEPGSWVTERKMLLTIKERAEELARAEAPATQTAPAAPPADSAEDRSDQQAAEA
jgi:hypothetical protein